MNTDPIQQAIEASRKREEGVTAAPWEAEIPKYVVAGEQKTYSVNGPPSDYMYLQSLEDAAFIAASRISEPAFREALAVAVEALQSLAEPIPSGDFAGEPNSIEAHEALAKIQEILTI